MNYQRSDASAYSNQQQYREGTNQPASSATHAAAALSSLSSQEYTPVSSGSRTGTSNQYENNSWYPVNANATSNVYSAKNKQVPNPSQSNDSPLYPTAQSSSTLGRISIPEQQSQSSSDTYGASQACKSTNHNSAASNRSYQTAYAQHQSQPQQYNSPLHVVQAQQHGHARQSSRSSNHQPSPQMQSQSVQQNRQQSASVEPTPMTVDPSQVYDNRVELQRKAQIEAEKKRKAEAEQAAKRAEEERIAEQKRKEEEARKADEEAVAAPAKKAEAEKKNAQRRKARAEKKQSKSAATTLQQMAAAMEAAAAEGGEDEAQMRAMFSKMREFNAKNPALLAKLWDEERNSHKEASKAASPPQPAATVGSSAAATSVSPAAPKAIKAAAKSTVSAQTQAAALSANNSRPAEQQTDKPGSNTSLWPPHKKSSLSEATAKWLNAMPANANDHVAPATVLNILNDNPSYVELCRSLENLGLKFDRGQLARELLRAVPDGMKAQSTAQPSTPLASVNVTAARANGWSASPGTPKGKGPIRKGSTNQAAGPTTVNYEAPISLSDAAREVNSMHQPSYQTPYGALAPPQQQPFRSPQITQSQTLTYGSRQPSQSQPLEIKQEVTPEEPPRPPADKEEAARKRTFGDLVDLTAEDSDDEAPPPKKMMQAPPAAANGANNQPQFLQKPVSFDQFMHRPTGQTMATSPYFPLPSNGPMPPPTQPVNQHQQPGFGLLQSAQLTPPPPPKQQGPTPEQLQQTRLRGKMLVEPIMRDRVARKSNYDSRTIARDVLLATGRHPDMRGLNAHLTNMQKLLAAHGGEFDSGGNRSDLSTIKWDVIDPAPSKDVEKVKVVKADEVEDESAGEKVNGNKRPKFGSPPVSEDRLIKRPRGRPPRHSLPSSLTNGAAGPSNAKSRSNTPARQASTSRPTTSASAPVAPAMSSAPSVGYAAFQQLNPDGTKKKGRPFGWKKTLHSREAQGLPKKTHPSTSQPSKLKQSPLGSKLKEVDPQYQEYKCRWDGCTSSLINLDTLKKHIVKIHGKEHDNREYMCFWEGCEGVQRPGLNGRVPAKYAQIEGWIQHVDQEHVRSIGWKLGDGPKGGTALGEASSNTLAMS